MSTSMISVALVLIAAFIGSFGPIFLKKASAKKIRHLPTLMKNYSLFFGLGFYGISTLFFIPALKGGQLSVLYPIVATIYVWSAMWSVFFLKEKMTTFKILGILCILIGITCIGLSG